jgi:hypothetical protein
MMTKNENNRELRTFMRAALSVAALGGCLVLGSCASDDEAQAEAPASAPSPDPSTAASAPAPQTFDTGAPPPRFIVPSAASQSPPSVNTVPTTAPTPKSTDEEREEARQGLVADLANARHSEQGGRTVPVVVRPYVASDQPAPPTVAETPPDEPITNRLDTPPPPRPADADGAPAKPAAGPAPANKIPTGS